MILLVALLAATLFAAGAERASLAGACTALLAFGLAGFMSWFFPGASIAWTTIAVAVALMAISRTKEPL